MSAPALVQFIQGVTTPSADNLNGMAQTCDTFADLQVFVGTIGMQVFVRGQNAIADGGQGVYYWNPGATQPSDNFTTIIPYGSLQGGWVRLPGEHMPAVFADGADFSTPSANPVMVGMNLTITPVTTGRLLVIGQGVISNDATGQGQFEMRYGSGSPPNPGDAATGAVFSTSIWVRAARRGNFQPASANDIIELYHRLDFGQPHLAGL